MTEVFSVFDKAVAAFMPPFFCRSKGEAIRSFSDAANSAEHNFSKHADDFVLYHLGEFDDTSGLFVANASHPARVISARECIGDRLESVDYSARSAAAVAHVANGR